jgi:histidine triad (HIT) family protein
MKTDCVFCQIRLGELPNATIYEDDDILAFLDINPVNAGHTLVIPKEHYNTIYDTPEETLLSLIRVVKKVSTAVKTGTEATGINVHLNNELDAGQVIPHIHFHVIPRFKNDGIKMWEQYPYPEGALETVQEKIRNAL